MRRIRLHDGPFGQKLESETHRLAAAISCQVKKRGLRNADARRPGPTRDRVRAARHLQDGPGVIGRSSGRLQTAQWRMKMHGGRGCVAISRDGSTCSTTSPEELLDLGDDRVLPVQPATGRVLGEQHRNFLKGEVATSQSALAFARARKISASSSRGGASRSSASSSITALPNAWSSK